MRYRRFGRTGLSMPVLTCGGMRFQHNWDDLEMKDIPRENQLNMVECVHRALELGINHIETARGYGSSEIQLGQVLPSLAREKMIVQTKVSPQATQKAFLEKFERSMKCLGLEYVDLLALHGINNQQLLDWAIGKNGCLAAARQLQREGRVRFVGFSTHATTDIILKTILTGEFDYANLHWYFVNPLNIEALEAARKQEMGVLIISPNDKGGRLYSPPKKLVELCSPLSPMAFNDLYCLGMPAVHTLSIGVSKPSDFDEHVAALKHYDEIPQIIGPIEARLRAEMERSLGAQWCARWFEQLPEYISVPGEVNVREILRLWTYAKSLDLNDWARMRYNLLGRGDHWFPGEDARQIDDERMKKALASSPFGDRIPAILREAHELFFDKPVHRLSSS